MDKLFQQEIATYEALRQQYQAQIAEKMDRQEHAEYSEILFSTHSCAIEGNTFSVDNTRELKEKGLGMIPEGKSLLEAFEMLDHFDAYEYMLAHLSAPLNEALIKEINKRVVAHTLAYRCPGAVAGEYTDTDMAAGDTVFGDHEQLVARVPLLLESTERAIVAARQSTESAINTEESGKHPIILAARFHGFYEYLHPFRDGNGRTGRLISNYILLRLGHPLLVIPISARAEYITALRLIRTERTDEHLIRFFFKMAIQGMRQTLDQKRDNTSRFLSFVF